MIKLSEARKLVRVPANTRLDETNVDRGTAWFFGYVRTTPVLGGSVGALVDKRDGSVHQVAHLDELEAYLVGLTAPAYDLFVDEVRDLEVAVDKLLRLHMLHVPPPAPGDIPRVRQYDVLSLEAHLGHAPCAFVLQDLRPWFREVGALELAECVTYRLAPAAGLGPRRMCPACVALGRDPTLTVAGFECPCCEYPTLEHDPDLEHERRYGLKCPVCGWWGAAGDATTLEEQRASYRQIGAIDSSSVRRVRSPNPAEIARRKARR